MLYRRDAKEFISESISRDKVHPPGHEAELGLSGTCPAAEGPSSKAFGGDRG